MPAELFVDTSAWFALANRQRNEYAAVELALIDRLQRRVRIVTTNLVVAETHALLMHRTSTRAALTFVTEVVVAPTLVVSSTPELEERARHDWLARYTDQSFSFTDAVSFAIMRERKIREALTLDRHFATAGFTMVP